jgi:hypothetical protein
MGVRHRPLQAPGIAADAELRRRHPGRKIEQLRSAEQGPVSCNEPEWPHPALQGSLAVPATRIGDHLAAQHQAFRARMYGRQRLMMPSEDLCLARPRETSLSLWASGRNTILQPPKPQIIPLP